MSGGQGTGEAVENTANSQNEIHHIKQTVIRIYRQTNTVSLNIYINYLRSVLLLWCKVV